MKTVPERAAQAAHYTRQSLAKAVPGAGGMGVSHAKNTDLASQYRRLAGCRGRKRALIAVGHSMLFIFYNPLKPGTTYADLGGDFFDRLEPQLLTRYYVRRFEALDHKVALESSTAA